MNNMASDRIVGAKTHGSVGILVVGIGGANGTTLLAGILANRLDINWFGPHGEEMSPNYNGCISQLSSRGGGVGYRDKIRGLADASMAAVGGWDIRPAKLGDALLEAQILDYDLVRQVREHMNKIKVFRGYYNPEFIGSCQHATATHILSGAEASTAAEALQTLRADIRYFKWRNGVVGHTTVIWSASVEPNCQFCIEGAGLDTAEGLLKSIEMTDEERGGALSPSLLYATAAILENCSFVNGGSQNTVACGGLAELARQRLGVYCLGTDFKAGQTKFKTAAVEYLRTMGLTPRVIASSNHLGNNDMRNLASADKARMAKLRVKHDIFAPWEEHSLDHKVAVMFTPFINDEKRDVVEYTSLGFLGQVHTMLTYTRASDSVLCVPLMIDASVWCDFFSRKSWEYHAVAKGLAYLFKVPEGAAKGVDPGFFAQMHELTRQLTEADATSPSSSARRRVRILVGDNSQHRNDVDDPLGHAEWAIPTDRSAIICAGLACVDMQLSQATGGGSGEAIETFCGETSIGGGSVCMTTKTLARLTHGAPPDHTEAVTTPDLVPPPVVQAVVPLCKIGKDTTGDKLLQLLEGQGDGEHQRSHSIHNNVITKFCKNARQSNDRTSLAVLPIYQDGRRGCFFDVASNATFSASDVVSLLTQMDLDTGTNGGYGAFLFGYPHLLPQIQGEALATVIAKARSIMTERGIIALDLNGVPEPSMEETKGAVTSRSMHSVAALKADAVLGAALSEIDILHLNEDELINLTGCEPTVGTAESKANDEETIANAVSVFLECGVAVVAVTRGKLGCFVSCNERSRFERSPMLPSSWMNCSASLDAVELRPGAAINTNGAGDSFTAGLLVAAMLRHTGRTVPFALEKDVMRESLGHGMESTPAALPSSPISSSQMKLTPYTLYIREHYVSLKGQCNDDKKEIFARCHEMWEKESAEVQAMYQRKLDEVLEEEDEAIGDVDTKEHGKETSLPGSNAVAGMDGESSNEAKQLPSFVAVLEDENQNLHLTNRALNLDSAVQFASLVASCHIDLRTRDASHLDTSELLERCMMVSHGLEEI